MKLLFRFPVLLVLLLVPSLRGAPAPIPEVHKLPPPPEPIPYISANPFAPAHVGQVFSYQIDASDTTSYAVSGLPSGLNVDAVTGLISGMPLTTGTFDVTLTASNYYTSNAITMTLTVGPELPSVSIKATRSLVVVGSGGHGAVKISRTGDLTQALTISVATTGSAVNGTDYKAIGNTVVLAPNQASANLRIVPSGSQSEDAVKIVKLKLVPGNDYQVGTVAKAKVTLVPGGQ